MTIRNLLLPALALAALLGCVHTPPNPNAAKYPARPNGCKVRVFYSSTPGVKEWDDLGMARAECYLDVGAVQCLRRLRIEACRMGGDLLYDVPQKPLRPTDQGMVYVGHVAHTRVKPEEPSKDDDTGDKPDDQAPEDAGPVQPIEPVALPTAAEADGRARPDGGADAKKSDSK